MPAHLRRVGRGALAALLVLMLAFVAAPSSAAGAAEGDPLTPELREVADARPLRIGWFEGAQPVAIVEDGEVVGGFAVELWELMALKLGIELEHVVHGSIVEVVEALRLGEVDVAGLQGERPDLLEIAGSTEPLAWDRLVLFGRAELATSTDVEFDGLTASTIHGSPLQAILESTFPELAYVQTGSVPEALAATAAGDPDLYLMTLGVGGWLTDELDLDLGPVGEFEQVIAVSAWALQDSAALAIARAGRDLLTPSELSIVTVRWSGYDLGQPPIEDEAIPVWAQRALLALLVLVVVLAAFTALLRRRVRSATRELHLVNEQLERRVEERTAELATTNEALDRMAHRAAHDLRGPLAAIRGLARLLLGSQLPEAASTRALEGIGRSADRLAELVDDLLVDASGGQRAQMTGEEFERWVRDVVGPEAQLAGAEIAVRAEPGRVGVDPVVLERVATNLVGNAVKYASNPMGTKVSVDLRHEDDGWILEVEDNGAGIPESRRLAVFERGTRLVDDERGVGHGLADVLDLVQRDGGAVELTDSPLGGARFRVRFARTSVASGPVVAEA